MTKTTTKEDTEEDYNEEGGTKRPQRIGSRRSATMMMASVVDILVVLQCRSSCVCCFDLLR